LDDQQFREFTKLVEGAKQGIAAGYAKTASFVM
jgi:hypothetical protein